MANIIFSKTGGELMKLLPDPNNTNDILVAIYAILSLIGMELAGVIGAVVVYLVSR